MLKRKITEVYSPNLVGVSPSLTVFNALKKMKKHNIGHLVVLENQNPVGVLTERNIVAGLANKGDDFKLLPVQEAMEKKVITVTKDTFFYDAFNLFLSNKTQQLIVVDKNGLAIGIVFISNLMEQFDYECFLDIKKVSHIMNRSLVTASPEETLQTMLRIMDKKFVSCLIIADGGKAEGIVTEADITRILFDGLDFGKLKARDVMSTPVHTVKLQMPLCDAAWVMRQRNIRHLVVTDDSDHLVGVITQSDIVRGLEGKYLEILKKIIQQKNAVLETTTNDLYRTSIYLDNILRSSMDMGIVATDRDLNIAYFNPGAEKILGYKSRDVIGKNFLEIHVREKMRPKRFKSILTSVRGGIAHNFHFVRSSEKSNRFIEARLSAIWGQEKNFTGFALMLKDVTEEKKAEETIKFLAFHDNLTGLPNRALFNERMQLELAHARRNRQRLGLMILDVDRFKNINDTLGHMVGDELLKELARRIKNILRKSDTVARMGGDEFYFILPQVQGRDSVEIIARKIIEELSRPYSLKGHTVHATASIGIAIFPLHGGDVFSLIKYADHAMYHAKSLNRNNSLSNTYTWPTPNGDKEPFSAEISSPTKSRAESGASSGC